MIYVMLKKPTRIKNFKECLLEGIGSISSRYGPNSDWMIYARTNNHDYIVNELEKKYTEKKENNYTSVLVNTNIGDIENKIERIIEIMSKLGWERGEIKSKTDKIYHSGSTYQVEKKYKGQQVYDYNVYDTEYGEHVVREKAYETIYEPGYTEEKTFIELEFYRKVINSKMDEKIEKYNNTWKQINDIQWKENDLWEKVEKCPPYYKIFLSIIPIIICSLIIAFNSEVYKNMMLLIIVLVVLFLSLFYFAFSVFRRVKIIKEVKTKMIENDRKISEIYQESLEILDE